MTGYELAALGLLALGIILILTGYLVPRGAVGKVNEERDQWIRQVDLIRWSRQLSAAGREVPSNPLEMKQTYQRIRPTVRLTSTGKPGTSA